MKKRNAPKLQPLFNRQRTIDSLIQNPNKFAELKKVMDKAYDVSERMQASKTLLAWHAYVISILPDFQKKTEFLTKLDELINEYNDESENDNSTKSC